MFQNHNKSCSACHCFLRIYPFSDIGIRKGRKNPELHILFQKPFNLKKGSAPQAARSSIFSFSASPYKSTTDFPLKYLFEFRPYRSRQCFSVDNHLPGMEKLVLQPVLAPEKVIDLLCAVFAITDNPVTCRCQMGPNLMGPPGNQCHLQECVPAVMPDGLIAGFYPVAAANFFSEISTRLVSVSFTRYPRI